MGDDARDATPGRGAAAEVERAMVAMRRSQSRRALARLARHEAQHEAGRENSRVNSRDAGAHPGTGAGAFGALDAVESGARTVTEVARALGVDQPRASRLVARAVADGLLVRAADQRDGRRALLALTAPGTDLLARAHRFREGVAAAAMADWTDHERREFATLLTRFVAGVTQATDAGAGMDHDAEGRYGDGR